MASPEAMVLEDLKGKPWFFGDFTRAQAELKQFLKGAEVGTFIVRPSSQKDCYALTYIMKNGTLAHSLIQRSAVGYKLPEENRVFPSITELLKTCKFLKFEEPVSPQALATLIEAFPNMKQEELTQALKDNKNDIVATIDYLLAKTAIAESSPSPSPSPAVSKVTKQMEEVRISDSIESVFFSLNPKNKWKDKKLITENWTSMERPLLNTGSYVSPTLEGNLQKILQNNSHPMGKKVDMFLLAFNANYSGLVSTPDDAGALHSKAVQEVSSFIESIQNSITAKVNEFNTPTGILIVWKVVENVIFHGVFPSLFQLYQIKSSQAESAYKRMLSNNSNITLAQLKVPSKYHLPMSPTPYLKSIETLQALPYVKTVYEKLCCLVGTCVSIVDTFKQYNQTSFSPSAPQSVPAEDMSMILAYVVCKAQVSNIHAELAFLKDFTPATLKSSLEGFALAALEAALGKLSKLNKQSSSQNVNNNAPPQQTIQQPARPPQADLIDFSQETPHAFVINASAPPETISKATSSHMFEEVKRPTNPPTTTPPASSPGFAATPFTPTPFGSSAAPSSTAPNTRFDTLQRAEKAYISTLKQMETVDAHNQLSVYYHSKGKLEKAIGHCKAALQMDPNNFVARQNLALYQNKLEGNNGGYHNGNPRSYG